jgi:hypothetical protein
MVTIDPDSLTPICFRPRNCRTLTYQRSFCNAMSTEDIERSAVLNAEKGGCPDQVDLLFCYNPVVVHVYDPGAVACSKTDQVNPGLT